MERKRNEEDNGRKKKKQYILPIKLKFRCGHYLRTLAIKSVETGSLYKAFLYITSEIWQKSSHPHGLHRSKALILALPNGL